MDEYRSLARPQGEAASKTRAMWASELGDDEEEDGSEEAARAGQGMEEGG